MAHQAAGRDRNYQLLDWLLPVTATCTPGAPPQGWPCWSTWLWCSVAHAALSSHLTQQGKVQGVHSLLQLMMNEEYTN